MPFPWLERVGLHRRELRAWASYDWANSVFMTTVMQVFQVYFADVAAAGLPPAAATQRFALTTSLSVACVALVSPFLGAAADHLGRKKAFLALFLAVGVGTTALLTTVGRGEWLWGAFLFLVANVGASASLVFYNSLLPHVARKDEVDRVSMAGYALGYLSGALLLALNALWIARPAAFGFPDDAAAMRGSFASAALWWAVFSLPVLLVVREPRPPAGPPARDVVRGALARLRATLSAVRGHRDAVLLLVAFVVYNDGVNTIIRLAAGYGHELGIDRAALLGTILLVQVVGIPCSFLAGGVAGRVGAKPTILAGLAVYVAISVLGYRVATATGFLVLGGLLGVVQGGVQGLTRSVFATMVPRHKSAEMFGFYGVFDKLGGMLGGVLFAVVIAVAGTSRPALLGVGLFFVVGGLVLCRVDVAAGQRAAQAAEAAAPSLPACR